MGKLKNITSLGWKSYKILAFVAGTVVFLYVLMAFILLTQKEKVHYFEVPLQSGFIYHYDMQDGSVDGHHLRDQHNRVIVYSDVIRFMESDKTIYGYRRDLHGNPFYFTCTYGEDCSDTQNLTDVDLRKIIAERKLPLYTENSGMSRSDFRREIERFNRQHSEGSEPEWQYDATWHKYRIVGEKKRH